ncbi:MAG: cation transporter [Fimbriimonadaceae bacterium]|nr:cation transporter [Fimbriimonadaceae bacterium]
MTSAGPGGQAVRRAVVVSLSTTVVVVVAKLAAAAASHSISVLSEALQSLVDVAMSVLTLWTVRLSSIPADDDHPYGHGRAEVISSAVQMLVVIGTAAVIAWQATLRLATPREIDPDWGLAAMAFAIVANTVVSRHLVKTARQYGSAALEGEAQHLNGDTWASVGVLAGLIAVKGTGWPVLDPLVAIFFTGLGAFFAVRQLVRLTHQLMDGSLPAEEVARVEEALRRHGHVRGFHNLRTRQTGQVRIVTLHVLLDDDLTFVEAHDLAEDVEASLRDVLGGALVTVHYEPYLAELEHQAREHQPSEGM